MREEALEYLGDELSRSQRTVAPDRPIDGDAAELVDDCSGDPLGLGLGIIHAEAGTVALQTMAHVKVLFEVVPQRKVDEWTPGSRQLHRGRQTPLDERDVTRRETLVQLGHVSVYLEPRLSRQTLGIDPRSAS